MGIEELEYLEMDFGEAMQEVLKGRHVRRLEWEDRNARLALINEQLMIFEPEDKMFHPLIISSGDLAGTDWVVTEEKTRTIQ